MDEELTPDFDEIDSGMEAVDVVEATLARFIDTADVSRVYGEPIQNGDTTILPAAEVLVGLGFGAVYGYGSNRDDDEDSGGGGGGGGGGGRTFSRPVAVIIASPEGVRVEPVIDPTKIALAALTAFGFMIGMMAQMNRKRIKFD